MRSSLALSIISLLVIGACSGFCFSQINFEESNWYKEIGRYDDPYSQFDLKKYTKEDVEKAKAKFLDIASARSSDEWAGSYRRQTMLGSSEITWDAENGYVHTHVYHTLSYIDYGGVNSTGDRISFAPERPVLQNRSRSSNLEYIKVRFGERHLLVPKDRLAEFAIWAVGREVPDERRAKEIEMEDGYFWEKIDDENKPIATIPTFPSAFEHLIRHPILAKLLAVGPLRIKRETSAQGATTSIDHTRTLTLSAGSNQGVKVGMRFWIDELEEWVDIVAVTANRSRARLERLFIDGREYCSRYENFNLKEFACREPRIGSDARTRVNYF